MLALAVALLLQAAPAAVPAGEKPVDPYVQSNANAGTTPLADPKVLAAFHGQEGLQRVAAGTIDRSVRDPRIKAIFADADIVRLKRTLAEQFCYLLGGGCTYTGRDMTTAHKGMGLQASDFNALVENLQAAMDTERVPFAAQNRLLARLAPMERVVVERKDPQALKQLSRRVRAMMPARD